MKVISFVIHLLLILLESMFCNLSDFHILPNSVCTDGKFQCSKISFNSKTPLNQAQPLCGDNFVYTDCLSKCPVTCENQHNPPTCDNSNCNDGCECLPGFVLDGDKCVNASMCPCHHAGKAYYEGEKYVQDCNEWFVFAFALFLLTWMPLTKYGQCCEVIITVSLGLVLVPTYNIVIIIRIIELRSFPV